MWNSTLILLNRFRNSTRQQLENIWMEMYILKKVHSFEKIK